MSQLLEVIPELPQLFQQAYGEGRSLAQATRFIVNELFGDFGLIVVDADHPRLKSQFTPIMQDELAHHHTQALVQKNSSRLLLLHLDLGGRADLDHRDTAGELGNALLQLFTVVVGGRLRINGELLMIADAYQAGIDAVVADNTLNRGGFVDALQSVITSQLSNAEGNAYIDAVAAEFARLGIINNPTYNNLRGNIIADAALHRSLYDALAVTLNALPEAAPVIEAARVTDLRETRDNVDAAITRLDDLIAAEPSGVVGRLVKDVFRNGKDLLRQHKQALRDEIRNILGDPDA